MRVKPLELPIAAPWTRSLVLKELRFTENQLVLLVEEEESSDWWQLTFKTVQAFRSTTEECSGPIFGTLPQDGALFEVLDSPWIRDLGDAHFLKKSHHYIICCYDEVIEVVAWQIDCVSQMRGGADV